MNQQFLKLMKELSLFVALFHILYLAGPQQTFCLEAFEEAHLLFLSSWKSEWWKERIWLQTFIYPSIYETKHERCKKKIKLCLVPIFAMLCKKRLQIWWCSAEKWQRISWRCSFHPFLIGLTPRSQSNSLPLSLFVSICSHWNFPVILLPCSEEQRACGCAWKKWLRVERIRPQ